MSKFMFSLVQSFKKYLSQKKSLSPQDFRFIDREKLKPHPCINSKTHSFHPPPVRKGEGTHSPQRADSTWTSAAYGELQFFHLISLLWALTLHRSQCQGPFLCSSDTGQHFLKKKKKTKNKPNPTCHCPPLRLVLNKHLLLYNIWSP